MRYYGLNDLSVLNDPSALDNGPAVDSVQHSSGNAPAGAAVADLAGGGSFTAPVFEEITDIMPAADFADGASSSAVTTSDSTNSSPSDVTTQTVTFANSGIVFNNTYTARVSAAYQSCILSAEQTIANTWHNACTINVEFDAQSPGQTGWLAENSFYTTGVSYASLKSALTSLALAEPSNTVLQQAVAHLPSIDPSNGVGLELPVAYAKMLGLPTPNQNPDTITLNTSYNWSYGQDVVNTIEHEISEGGMGRIGGLGDDNNFWSTMDLFRYNSSQQPDYSDGRDGKTTYFSYNGGATLSSLSFNNEFNSQGAQVNTGDTADFKQLDVFGTGSPGETNALSATDIQIMEALGWAPAGGPAPTVTATAVMVMSQPSTGNYEIYDVGNNTILNGSLLTQVGSPWQAAAIGGFNGSDTSDLLLRNSSTGAFELYDVVGNNATGPVTLGTVGLNWSVLGFGDFSSNPGETDMLMRNSSTAALEVYDISNNQIASGIPMGAVGAEWQFLGTGDFSSNANETDMLMRNVNTGALEVYNISKNAVVGAAGMGAIGLEWSFVGVGDFSGNPGETDMLMRDTNNGALEVYNIHNDQIVSAKGMGAVGVEWSLVGTGDFSGNPGETDMIMRDSSNGALEVYDIRNDSIVSASSLGAVGTDWQAIGVAPYSSASGAVASGSSAEPESIATDVPAALDQGGGSLGAPNLSSPAAAQEAAGWYGGGTGTPWLQSIMENGSGSSSLAAPAAQIGSVDSADNGPASLIAGTLLPHTT